MSRQDLRVVTGARATSQTAHNGDAELAILATVIDEPSTLSRAVVLGLLPHHFHVDANGRAWEALLRMSEIPDTSIHVVTVAQWLKDRDRPPPDGGWTAYLSRHATMIAPLEACVLLVIELADVRAVVAQCEAVAAEGRAPIIDRAAWLTRAAERITGTITPRTKPVPAFAQIAVEVHEQLVSEEVIAGYPTGHRVVDERIGGLECSAITMLTGVEKSGKSSLGALWCANVADRSRRGRRVGALILQWEDERTKTVARLVGGRAKVDLARRRTGLWNQADHQKFIGALDEFGDLALKIEDDCAPRVVTIAARVRAVRDEWAAAGILLGVVMIDSLQLLEDEGQNREQQIENSMKRLAALKRAKDLKEIAWLVINHTTETGDMVNARQAPKRWINTWLNLRVEGADKEEPDGARPAHLELRLARDMAAGGAGIPLWCYRHYNSLFEDGGPHGRR
jgi:replicative DNA helicase